MSADATDRLQALDGLRAVAVAMVIASHWGLEYPGVRLARLAARSGWAGVDLFFVLSGFLVSGLLFREHRRRSAVDVKRFLVRRGLKIYPAFYAFFVICLVGFPHLRGLGDARLTVGKVLSEALFVQNYWPGIWGHTWSLAVEEHFYIVMAIVIGVLVRRRLLDGNIKRATVAVTVVAAVCLAMRASFALGGSYSWRNVYAPTQLRIDSLFFGVYLSYCYAYEHDRMTAFVRRRRTRIALVSAALASTCVVFQRDTAPMYTIGLTLLAVGFGGFVVLAVASERLPRVLAGAVRLLAPVGRSSYSIYLWHAPVIIFVHGAVARLSSPVRPWAELTGDLALSAAVGVAASRLVEFPSLHLRDRLYPSRIINTVPALAIATSSR